MKKVVRNRNNKGKKLIKRLIFNTVLLFIVLSICGIFLNYNLANKEIKTSEIVISKEDTIWSLAKGICNKRNDLNIQNVIIEIKEINNLKTSDIYEGQVLNIPVY